MRTLFSFLLMIFTIPFLTSCQGDLESRRKNLEQREAELKEKEAAFALKATDYQILLSLRDSLESSNDSLHIPKEIAFIEGIWKGKMVCTETSCSDYVVGDVRIDEWEIRYNSGVITAKNFNKAGSVRVYTGTLNGSMIHLEYQSPKSQQPPLDLQIDLTSITETKLSGTRIVKSGDNCVSKFSIDFTK